MAVDPTLVTTAFELPAYRIVRGLGMVRGILVRSRSIVGTIGPGLLTSSPAPIAYLDSAPPGIPHVEATEPAGCGYWRRAANGETFFTVADDHKRCPVGAHTHNVPLSAAEQDELMGLVKTMVGLSY